MTSDNDVQRDQLLRGAVLAGDEGAWQTWYTETYDDLYRYVRWRCAGLQDRADEIVQETWLTAVRRVRRFDPSRGSFRGWLRGIAANVLRNHLRTHRVSGKRQHGFDSEPVVDGTAEAPLENRERSERIIAVLDALPERHEDVLRAKYLDGLSVAEIARSREETPKAVESLLTRARQKFRDIYRRFEQNGKPGQS